MRATIAVRGTLALAIALAACGGAQRRGERTPTALDRLRAEAAARPEDRALALALASAEHLSDGADPERAREALSRARELAPDDLRLGFLAAEQHVLEGEPALALSGYLALLEAAPASSDPLAKLLAEAALQAVLDMNDATDDYRARVRAALGKLHERADGLGLEAAHQLRMAGLGHATQDGDAARAREFARAAGCVERVDVAGPFGPRELLSFDYKLAAEAPGPLAAEHDLGPGREVRPRRTLETRRCAFGLARGAHDALPGASVLRTELAAEAGSYALRVESPNSYVVWLDGRELARVDLRNRHATGVRYLPLALGAGKHELKLKISSRHPNPVLSLALVKADPAAIEATRLPALNGELERYLLTKLALGRGDVVSARELMRKLQQAAPSAHWLVLEAAIALSDPLKSPEFRRDRARELLTRAERQNPRAWYPSVGLARLASAEGRAKEAIEALRAAQKKWPQANAVHTSLIEQLRESGYVEEAEQLTRQLAQELPNACAVVNLSLQAAKSRGQMAEVARLTERAMACDQSSSARLSLLKLQHKYEQAAAELARLESLGEPLDETQALENELERARLLGDQTKVRALRERRTARWPDRPEPVLDRADALLASGDKRGAHALLASALAKYPSELYELRRVHEALSSEELFKDFRKRGEQVIRAFEAAERGYRDPEVLVLDYTVLWLFEDGSSVDLTHNIIRMQSQEAVDENGEFTVPDGARLLSLRTIKADGTRLEPDAIPGKSSWSLPNLAPGDYVEFEFVRGRSPSLGFPGGFLGERFYFKSFEVSFDHSELAVVLPPGMEPLLDPRGPLPALVKESRAGRTILRWTAEQSRALSPEPHSVAMREFLPSINLGVKVSWEAYVESLRDLLIDKDVYDPAAQEFVSELLGPLVNASASARAEALYRWVTDEIEATDDVFGSAAAMLSARTGSRERVLKYALSLAGIESALVLVRGAEADHSKATLPDPETFSHLVLRVETERGPVFLHAGARHAPFGYLPPPLRGEKALVVNPRAELTETPAGSLEGELRSIELEVALSAEGAAQLHVRETHRGASAVQWRNDLDSIPVAELNARFEHSYAANVVPGAQLERLKIEAREDPDAPLVLDYELAVSELGQRSGTQQRIGGLFPGLLSARFARQGSRSTTELVAPAQAVEVRTRFSLPKAARVLSLPKAGALTSPQKANLSAQAAVGERRVELARSLRLPIARVTPGEYPSFAAFCQAADALEASELVIEFAEAD